MNLITLFVTIVFVFLVVLFIVLHKEIMSFFFPNDYLKITMKEHDRKIRSWLMKKSPEKKFTFQKEIYYTIDNTPDKSATSYSGRLTHYFFREGNKFPVSFGETSSLKSKIDDEMLKLQLSKMWDEPKSSIEEFLAKYWWVLVIIGLILLAIIMTRQPAPVPLQATGG